VDDVGVSELWIDQQVRSRQLATRPLRRMGSDWYEQPHSYFRGEWTEHNVLNVPGAFYGAETDTTGEGPDLAPASVALDLLGQAFLWRQPRNDEEIHAVMTAASSDPLGGYGWNGDTSWTPDLVAAWWDGRRSRTRITDALAGEIRRVSPERADEFWEYSTSGAGPDLERYSTYLERARTLGLH
jgi:hypothetical protein